jgi:Tol biopolymer transport system component
MLTRFPVPRAACFAVLVAMGPFAAAGARAATNPRLHWKTISTEHFDVHFHEGEEWTGQEVAKIAEEMYGPITRLYDYEPKRCHFVLLDTEDYANGAAYYYDNKIEIWATNLEFQLRGTTPWLRNVVTHEFTHIVSIQSAMKMPLRIPAIYLQAVGFESEKRPDVINGYPDMIVSYPITGTVVPGWWAEGVAQYQAPNYQNDCWDTHRDMILRAAVVEDRMLSYDEMGFLGHRSLGNEQVYDHGFGLVRYIAATYGPGSLDTISTYMGKWYRLTIDGALKQATGKKGGQLYDDWKASLTRRYDAMLAPVYANPRAGTILSDAGFMTHSPSFSPDGKSVAFLSNKGSDYARTDLYLSSRDGKAPRELMGDVTSRAVFSLDGKRLVYGKHTKVDKYGAMVSDLYVYDLASRKEKRLTRKARAADPQWSPDGRTIVCVLNGDGTHRLATIGAAGGELRVLLAGEPGRQFYAPQFSPDGSRVLFGVFTTGTRDLASIAADGSDFRYELKTSNDERDARWTPDGRGIVFASDRSGIFDIYRMDATTHAVEQLTHVIGGAFMPDLAASGELVYAEYAATGYRVSILEPASEPVARLAENDYAVRATGEFEECGVVKGGIDASGAAFSPDSTAALAAGSAGGEGSTPAITAPGLATSEAKPYKWDYTGFQFYPRVVIWDGTPRLGLFASSNEILDRQSLFFGGSYGVDGEFDAIVNFELRRLFPVLFMQYYRVRQNYDDQFPIEDLARYYFVDYKYDVWSADLGLRFEFADPYSLTHRNDLSIWWNHSEYSIHLDPEYVPIDDLDAPRSPDQPVSWKYFIGNEAHLHWHFKSIGRAVDSDINPRGGRQIDVELTYANDDLFQSGEFQYGVRPDFTRNQFGQYTVDWREYLALPAWRHTLELRVMGSFIDNDVDDFFWVYMGGMDRLRGYTYYAIGGRKGALASATYRFPIFRQVARQASWLTFKDLYGAVFYAVGSAWNQGNTPRDDPAVARDYYTSAGGELRLNLGSFYSYPTTIDFSAAYALDQATYVNPIFDVPAVVYDPQWRYYLMVGFTF